MPREGPWKGTGGTKKSRMMHSHFRLTSLARVVVEGSREVSMLVHVGADGVTYSRQREAWIGHHRVEKMVSSSYWMRATVG